MIEQRRTIKELAVLYHRRALVLTAAAAYRPIYYKQRKIPFQMVWCRRIKLCCRCKASSKRWLQSVHVIITSCYLCTCMRVISLNNAYFGVCNYTISKLLSRSLKRTEDIKYEIISVEDVTIVFAAVIKLFICVNRMLSNVFCNTLQHQENN